MMSEKYLLLARVDTPDEIDTLWREVAEFSGPYPEKVLSNYLADLTVSAPARAYMVLSRWSRDVFEVSPRTEYTVEKVQTDDVETLVAEAA